MLHGFFKYLYLNLAQPEPILRRNSEALGMALGQLNVIELSLADIPG